MRKIYVNWTTLFHYLLFFELLWPSVYNRFDTTEIIPQMNATTSIIVLISSKVILNLGYELGEK